MALVDARAGYRLWAPSYGAETAVSFLEDALVRAMTPPLAGRRLLDAGCGTGRRLRSAGAAIAVGVDLSPEMLAAGGPVPPGIALRPGDVRALPVPDHAFDMVWCRLVIGHLPDCRPVYRELARAADAGARIVVSDFHPAAYRAGHRRSFRAGETVYELEHHVHDMRDHLTAAADCGLELIAAREAKVGPEVRHFYLRAGREALYRRDLGVPIVLALTFQRPE